MSRQRRDETLVSFLQNQIEAEEAVNGGADEMVKWILTDHLNMLRDITHYASQTGPSIISVGTVTGFNEGDHCGQ